jgi:hypothetical protein
MSRWPAASSFSTRADVKDLVLLPISNSVRSSIGTRPVRPVVPVTTLKDGFPPPRLTKAEIAEMPSGFRRVSR